MSVKLIRKRLIFCVIFFLQRKEGLNFSGYEHLNDHSCQHAINRVNPFRIPQEWLHHPGGAETQIEPLFHSYLTKFFLLESLKGSFITLFSSLCPLYTVYKYRNTKIWKTPEIWTIFWVPLLLVEIVSGIWIPEIFKRLYLNLLVLRVFWFMKLHCTTIF